MAEVDVLLCDGCGVPATAALDGEIVLAACDEVACRDAAAELLGIEWPAPAPRWVPDPDDPWERGDECRLHDLAWCWECKPRAVPLPSTVWVATLWGRGPVHASPDCRGLRAGLQLLEHSSTAEGCYSPAQEPIPQPRLRVSSRVPCAICWPGGWS